MKPLGEWEVWLVTGSQELYGPEVLREVEAHAGVIAAGLDASPAIPVRVVCQPVVTSSDAIRRLVLEADAAPRCLGLMAWMHTFSPAQMWIPGLQALGKPLLHLHTQFGRDLPWSTIDMDFMNLHQSAHGDREFGYLETRLGIARATVVGHWEDPEVQARIGVWARAARGLAEARSLRVARFGDNMRQVAVTEGDKVEARIRLGVSVEGRGVSEVAEAAGAAPDSAVDDIAAAYLSDYEVAPELLPGGARHRSLRDAARIECGLRSVLAAGGYRAFTDTFEDLGALRQLPGIAVQRLMGEGYGFGAEGDWKSAILVRVLKAMAAGLPGGTSFMEDYTYHLDPFAPLVLGAHMLEVCPSIAGTAPRVEIHPLAIGNREDPVRLVFTAAPGPAIVVGLLDLGTRFRLVLNEIEVVVPPEPLPRLPVARAVWRPAPDLPTAAACWMLAGGPHHTALSTQLATAHLVDFADMAGIELVAIDGSSSEHALRRELRWNEAAWRLGC